ncbi:hypothetical protein [Flavobacterium sp.]|jgi:hypothetical protein|uniref:hypothetical protein n=1 Tax=Flavobacterium sp. TaxID=239 RepID=UPI00286F7E45|nr:hypothetical protein [Flavobacterium sp.]
MNENNPDLKLLTISVINLLFQFFIWGLTKRDSSSSLGYMFFLFIGWIILLVITGIIIYKDKIKLRTWNMLLFIFCTPIPFVLFIVLSSGDPIMGTYEYHKNKHQIKEILYDDRKEYFSSVDTTSEKYPIPLDEKYHLDSIIYYEKNGKIIKTIYFK